MKVRPAAAADLDAVARIYEEIHTAEETGRGVTGWIRGVYPVRATAEDAIQRGDLFVMELDGEICGAAIINQTQVDVYALGSWALDVPPEQVCVLHTLVISPRAKGRGCGSAFVDFYEAYARSLGCRALRMDTNARNTRARALYARLGYQEVGVVPTVFNGIPDVQLVLLEKQL